MSIRLNSANTETARRTLELTKFRPKESMSSAEKHGAEHNPKRARANMAFEKRISDFSENK